MINTLILITLVLIAMLLVSLIRSINNHISNQKRFMGMNEYGVTPESIDGYFTGLLERLDTISSQTSKLDEINKKLEIEKWDGTNLESTSISKLIAEVIRNLRGYACEGEIIADKAILPEILLQLNKIQSLLLNANIEHNLSDIASKLTTARIDGMKIQTVPVLQEINNSLKEAADYLCQISVK